MENVLEAFKNEFPNAEIAISEKHFIISTIYNGDKLGVELNKERLDEDGYVISAIKALNDMVKNAKTGN